MNNTLSQFITAFVSIAIATGSVIFFYTYTLTPHMLTDISLLTLLLNLTLNRETK